VRPGRGASRRIVWSILLLVFSSPVAAAQSRTVVLPIDSSARVVYRKGLDLPLIDTGIGLFLTGVLIDTDRRAVPPQGLDPAQIKLEMDRRIVGNSDVSAADLSDALSAVSLAFPLMTRLVSASRGERWCSTENGMLLYAEAVGLSGGISMVTKKLVSRPRPYTYLPYPERPGGARYDANRDHAFQSFPSGHATFAWCAASLGITDHLLMRPRAGWAENAAIAFAGGALATAASALRVAAGQHFPTDVLVGSAIGVASGVTVPLVHRYVVGGEARARSPQRSAWLVTAAGTAAGIVAGIIVANAGRSD